MSAQAISLFRSVKCFDIHLVRTSFNTNIIYTSKSVFVPTKNNFLSYFFPLDMLYSGISVHERLSSRTPVITNASHQERLSPRTNRFTNKFSEQKSLGLRTVSQVTNTQATNNGWRQAGSIGGRASVAVWLSLSTHHCYNSPCLLLNFIVFCGFLYIIKQYKLVSVYEHFGRRTASRNELNSLTEVPLYFAGSWLKVYSKI
jgi:hypothetical protein